MASKAKADAAPSLPELSIMRLLDAPRELVFKAWTDPRHIVRWWGPKGFAAPTCEMMDVRVGGGFRLRMPSHDGIDYVVTGVYREILAPERLVYDDNCAQNGKLFHRALMTVLFDEQAAGTKLTLSVRLLPPADRDPRWTLETMRQGWQSGWCDNLENLRHYLKEEATP